MTGNSSKNEQFVPIEPENLEMVELELVEDAELNDLLSESVFLSPQLSCYYCVPSKK